MSQLFNLEQLQSLNIGEHLFFNLEEVDVFIIRVPNGFIYDNYRSATFIPFSDTKQKIEDITTVDLNVITLKEMMKDPKYWKEHDPEYVKIIEEGFKKLYS